MIFIISLFNFRLNLFFLFQNNSVDVHVGDIKNYVKFLLEEREDQEKQELLNNFRSKVTTRNKNIYIEYI